MIQPQRRESPPVHLKMGVITHLIDCVPLFGSITIRFENGQPTLIERHENVRLSPGPVSRT